MRQDGYEGEAYSDEHTFAPQSNGGNKENTGAYGQQLLNKMGGLNLGNRHGGIDSEILIEKE